MKKSRESPGFFSVGEVSTRLKREYGEKRVPRKRPGVIEEMVRTILSQNTTDLNSGRAYANLRRTFPGWSDVASAPVSRIAGAIRVGGLADQKARRIKKILGRIKKEHGDYSLQHLCKKPTGDARQYLLGFKGVGEKTAACVLLFACGKPAFPVDTHIFRLGRRLGWLDSKISVADAHRYFEKKVPQKDMYSLHLNMIAHGREACHSQKPECSRCCLKSRCYYYRGIHEYAS